MGLIRESDERHPGASLEIVTDELPRGFARPLPQGLVTHGAGRLHDQDVLGRGLPNHLKHGRDLLFAVYFVLVSSPEVVGAEDHLLGTPALTEDVVLGRSHRLAAGAASESLLFGAELLDVREKGKVSEGAGDVVVVGQGGLEEAGGADGVGGIAALLPGDWVTPGADNGAVTCACRKRKALKQKQEDNFIKE